MARRGENIRKRTDGRWEGRYFIYINGSKKYRSVYGHSYNETKQKLFNCKKEAVQTQALGKVGNDRIISEIGQLWLANIKANRKYSTYKKYTDIYNKYVRDSLGKLKINEINQELAAQTIPKDLSASLYKSIYCVLNQILLHGSRYCDTPRIHLSAENLYTTRKPVQTITLTDQKKLCDYLLAEPDTCKLGILMCLHMGLRLGEICALKWEDIDFQYKTLHVSRTVQRLPAEDGSKKTILYEGPPKTLCSVREIPIPEFLYHHLLSYKDEGIYVLNKFSPMEPRTYQYKFHSYLKKALIKKSHFHTLRHTFATNCISSGADVKSVSEILGHSNVNITLNKYVHPSMDTKRNILDSLSFINGQNGGQIPS